MITDAPVAYPAAGKRETPVTFTAVVLAGMRPEGDPVADFFGCDCKALTPLRGRPMIQHVVEALGAVKAVERIVLVGNAPERFAPLAAEIARANPRVSIDVMKAAAGSISDSVRRVLDTVGENQPLLITTGDAPLLTPAIVEEFTRAASAKPGIAIGMVEREIVRRAYPDTVRTYLPFRDTAVSGANLFALGGRDVRRALEFWKAIEQDRKRVWKFLAAFGPANLAGMALRRFTLDQALERAGRVMGCAVRAVRLPVAEAAMDVDSVQDFFLAERILESRARAGRPVRPAQPAEMPWRFAVFDLDRTITRRGTFTAFLLSTRRGLPARAALLARLVRQMLRYKLGRIDRLTLKNRMLALAARGMSRREWDEVAERFVRRVVRAGIRPGFLPALVRHRRAGDTVVLATASIDLYARLFADHFRFDRLVCTPTAFAALENLPPKIAGRNCLGREKLALVEEALLPGGATTRETIFVSAYSDDLVDLPLLEWADASTVVNPTKKSRAAAVARGMRIVQW
jgi:HAD superfamily phosphoserine phosphatase-like hydrolase